MSPPYSMNGLYLTLFSQLVFSSTNEPLPTSNLYQPPLSRSRSFPFISWKLFLPSSLSHIHQRHQRQRQSHGFERNGTGRHCNIHQRATERLGEFNDHLHAVGEGAQAGIIPPFQSSQHHTPSSPSAIHPRFSLHPLHLSPPQASPSIHLCDTNSWKSSKTTLRKQIPSRQIVQSFKFWISFDVSV